MMIGDKNKDSVADELLKSFIQTDSYKIYLLENQSEYIGFYVFNVNPFEGSNGIGEVIFLGIGEKHRGYGYGKKMEEHIEYISKKLNVRKLYVLTNPKNKKAVCFWINMGYEFEARMKDFSSLGDDDYYLGKKINNI